MASMSRDVAALLVQMATGMALEGMSSSSSLGLSEEFLPSGEHLRSEDEIIDEALHLVQQPPEVFTRESLRRAGWDV